MNSDKKEYIFYDCAYVKMIDGSAAYGDFGFISYFTTKAFKAPTGRNPGASYAKSTSQRLSEN